LKSLFKNIQTVFILILAVALILSFIFRPSKPIETYENEINLLKQQNQQLLLSNDSINFINTKLQKEINVILYAIDSTKVALKETENKLEILENKRNEVSTIINNMDSDDITNTFSSYLKRRGKGNN
jgi:Tfp pilus assembly protein PilN|tara:strand:+ start:198 stop:578 length:381 start_codon:yes stop_codon:yes gene_type:complete